MLDVPSGEEWVSGWCRNSFGFSLRGLFGSLVSIWLWVSPSTPKIGSTKKIRDEAFLWGAQHLEQQWVETGNRNCNSTQHGTTPTDRLQLVLGSLMAPNRAISALVSVYTCPYHTQTHARPPKGMHAHTCTHTNLYCVQVPHRFTSHSNGLSHAISAE
jgi:hypothetical protein